ncbi:hypothetical protein LXL04_010728 [Taraxacum kok-saghyz]
MESNIASQERAEEERKRRVDEERTTESATRTAEIKWKQGRDLRVTDLQKRYDTNPSHTRFTSSQKAKCRTHSQKLACRRRRHLGL